MGRAASKDAVVQSRQSGGLVMSRTRRLREEVLNLLEDRGTANTVEIFDHLNDRFRWGATMNQVGNIMAKDSRFSKVGHVRGPFRGSVYTVCVWGLSQKETPLAVS
jgi:hypothetical protein|tara:strand:+ start:2360 stop:2677 length:318 start_codon:yes stop_codon:yes gene_type:complete